jgi:hypothetical protein
LVQSKNFRINCVRSFCFHNQKDGGGDAQTIKNKHRQITGQANQGKGKKKGGGCISKNCSIGSSY